MRDYEQADPAVHRKMSDSLVNRANDFQSVKESWEKRTPEKQEPTSPSGGAVLRDDELAMESAMVQQIKTRVEEQVQSAVVGETVESEGHSWMWGATSPNGPPTFNNLAPDDREAEAAEVARMEDAKMKAFAHEKARLQQVQATNVETSTPASAASGRTPSTSASSCTWLTKKSVGRPAINEQRNISAEVEKVVLVDAAPPEKIAAKPKPLAIAGQSQPYQRLDPRGGAVTPVAQSEPSRIEFGCSPSSHAPASDFSAVTAAPVLNSVVGPPSLVASSTVQQSSFQYGASVRRDFSPARAFAPREAGARTVTTCRRPLDPSDLLPIPRDVSPFQVTRVAGVSPQREVTVSNTGSIVSTAGSMVRRDVSPTRVLGAVAAIGQMPGKAQIAAGARSHQISISCPQTGNAVSAPGSFLLPTNSTLQRSTSALVPAVSLGSTMRQASPPPRVRTIDQGRAKDRCSPRSARSASPVYIRAPSPIQFSGRGASPCGRHSIRVTAPAVAVGQSVSCPSDRSRSRYVVSPELGAVSRQASPLRATGVRTPVLGFQPPILKTVDFFRTSSPLRSGRQGVFNVRMPSPAVVVAPQQDLSSLTLSTSPPRSPTAAAKDAMDRSALAHSTQQDYEMRKTLQAPVDEEQQLRQMEAEWHRLYGTDPDEVYLIDAHGMHRDMSNMSNMLTAEAPPDAFPAVLIMKGKRKTREDSFFTKPPEAPPCLVAGLPDPPAVEAQKAQYERDLIAKEKEAEDNLRMQEQRAIEHIRQLYGPETFRLEGMLAQADARTTGQEREVMLTHAQQLSRLQDVFSQKRVVLNQQAANAIDKYTSVKQQEDALLRQYEVQQAAYAQPGRSMNFPVPTPPAQITLGLANPSDVEANKNAYYDAMETERNESEASLRSQQERELSIARQGNDSHRRALQQELAQVQKAAAQQEEQVCAKYAKELLVLQQVFAQHHQELERKANEVLTEYNARKTQQDQLFRKYEEQRTAYDEHIQWCSDKVK